MSWKWTRRQDKKPMMQWQERWLELTRSNEKVATVSLALRAALAGMGAVMASQTLRLPYTFYALIAAVIVSDAAPQMLRYLGFHRLLGTAVGAIIGGLLGTLFGHALWAVGLAVFLTVLICQFARLKEAIKVAGYVSGLIVLSYGSAPWRYARDRFVETALGIACALVVSLLLPVDQEPAT